MSIPPRWRNCPRKGKLIADKFLPFKTPLSAEYDRELSEEHRFPPSMMTDYMNSCGRRLGLVIDLTKTNRYYDKRELLLNNYTGHHKLICEGHGAAPDAGQVQAFITICKQFFHDHPGDVIGVHCTHGFNRTGFLIIAYLVEEDCWDLEAAVATFSLARPPGIYKEQYLKELADRYSGGDMGDIVAPSQPDWCFEEEESTTDTAKSSAAEAKPQKMKENKKQQYHDNEQAEFAVPLQGVHSVTDHSLRQQIQKTCQDSLNWESHSFPGCQPVSMDVQNIRFLHEKPYRVSWKADGTRYLLYIKERGQIYLINRDNSVFSCPGVSFLSRKRENEHLKDCVADSELVIDNDKGVKRPRLLIYDIMMFEGSKDIALCDHQRRMLCIEKELIFPRERAAGNRELDKSTEPFSIRAKTFWDISETRWVLESFMPQLTHETDGLIFNPLNDPYQAGQCDNLLKWKPAELNTVDFRLNIVTDQRPDMIPVKIGQLLVGSGSQVTLVDTLDLKLNKEAKQYDKKIIECCFEKGKWKFLRVRSDKSFPNSYDTAIKVCQSIKQPVTKEWLLKVCEEYRWKPTGTKRSAEENSSMSAPHPKRPPQ